MQRDKMKQQTENETDGDDPISESVRLHHDVPAACVVESGKGKNTCGEFGAGG